MDRILSSNDFKFRNQLFKKYKFPIFYIYMKENNKIIYTFIDDNKIVNYSIEQINNFKNMIAIPINFTLNLYELDYEKNFMLIRCKDFYKWLYIYNQWVIKCNKTNNLTYKLKKYFYYLNHKKLFFLYI
jgi:hypothetical protein